MFVVENYTITHSKWIDMNPVFGEQCSYIRNNGYGGFWYSTNCSDEHPVVCGAHLHDRLEFILPLVAPSTTEYQTERVTKESPVTSEATTYLDTYTAGIHKSMFT